MCLFLAHFHAAARLIFVLTQFSCVSETVLISSIINRWRHIFLVFREDDIEFELHFGDNVRWQWRRCFLSRPNSERFELISIAEENTQQSINLNFKFKGQLQFTVSTAIKIRGKRNFFSLSYQPPSDLVVTGM